MDEIKNYEEDYTGGYDLTSYDDEGGYSDAESSGETMKYVAVAAAAVGVFALAQKGVKAIIKKVKSKKDEDEEPKPKKKSKKQKVEEEVIDIQEEEVIDIQEEVVEEDDEDYSYNNYPAKKKKKK